MPTLEPNVVVAAADLNGVGALEVCRAAVAIPRPAVVILMAKYLDFSEATRAIGAGACDFVRTPVDSEELLTRIEVHLRVARGRSHDSNGARGTTPSPFGLLPAAATPSEGLVLRRVRAPKAETARARILLFQPDPQMGRALRVVLRLRGFAATLMHSAIGSAAAALTRVREAIVVDVGQGEGDALAFCLTLRQCGFQGKLIATARAKSRSLEARARDAGIDEVVPFLEVVRHLEAEFPPRRSSGAPSAPAGEDPRAASVSGALAALTPGQRPLFKSLLAADGGLVPREVLKARGMRDSKATDAALHAQISRMRPTLELFGFHVDAERGSGYRCVWRA